MDVKEKVLTDGAQTLSKVQFNYELWKARKLYEKLSHLSSDETTLRALSLCHFPRLWSSSTSKMLRSMLIHSHLRLNRKVFMSSSGLKTSYVHPLSQIVLEHLQNSDSWLKEMGLDMSVLELRKDGTFNLVFPRDEGRIWTSFDRNDNKHYLNVHKNKIVGRYVLQDNAKPAWHLSKESTPERVQNAVSKMMGKLAQEEGVK